MNTNTKTQDTLASLSPTGFDSMEDNKQQSTVQHINTEMIVASNLNPRTIINDKFTEIKDSIQCIGLQQLFSVALNPKIDKYELIKGDTNDFKGSSKGFKGGAIGFEGGSNIIKGGSACCEGGGVILVVVVLLFLICLMQESFIGKH